MITIASAVSQILSQDGLATETITRGLLNLSAYAKTILPQVEELARKPVGQASVVTALSRLAGELSQHQEKDSSYLPHITIDHFSITSGLLEITCDKTDAVLSGLAHLRRTTHPSQLLATTIGLNEITLICSHELKGRLLAHLPHPKTTLSNLVAITLQFSDSYMETSNTVYSLVGIFALPKINLIEIISTYTELTFVIYQDDLQAAIQAIASYQNPQTSIK